MEKLEMARRYMRDTKYSDRLALESQTQAFGSPHPFTTVTPGRAESGREAENQVL